MRGEKKTQSVDDAARSISDTPIARRLHQTGKTVVVIVIADGDGQVAIGSSIRARPSKHAGTPPAVP